MSKDPRKRKPRIPFFVRKKRKKPITGEAVRRLKKRIKDRLSIYEQLIEQCQQNYVNAIANNPWLQKWLNKSREHAGKPRKAIRRLQLFAPEWDSLVNLAGYSTGIFSILIKQKEMEFGWAKQFIEYYDQFKQLIKFDPAKIGYAARRVQEAAVEITALGIELKRLRTFGAETLERWKQAQEKIFGLLFETPTISNEFLASRQKTITREQQYSGTLEETDKKRGRIRQAFDFGMINEKQFGDSLKQTEIQRLKAKLAFLQAQETHKALINRLPEKLGFKPSDLPKSFLEELARQVHNARMQRMQTEKQIDTLKKSA